MSWLQDFVLEYASHASLNFGQALQGIRYFYSHPDIDRVAPRGGIQHLRLSVLKRAKLVGNDLFFSSLPPHWHHTKDEIKTLHAVSVKKWFFYGYCAWRFDETGAAKVLDGTEDPRWDPRCL